MGKRRTHSPPKDWQTDKRKGRRQSYCPIYTNLLTSPAYIDLTSAQKALYIACRDREMYPHPQETGTAADDRLFYMNRALYVKTYRLYAENNKRGFFRDIKALISHGFISVYRSGKTTRTKNIYSYSSRWKEWQPGKDYTQTEGDHF